MGGREGSGRRGGRGSRGGMKGGRGVLGSDSTISNDVRPSVYTQPTTQNSIEEKNKIEKFDNKNILENTKNNETKRDSSRIVKYHERELGIVLCVFNCLSELTIWSLACILTHVAQTWASTRSLTMQRIAAINPDQTMGKAKQLLDGVQTKLGMTPNLMKTLATAPAALDAYIMTVHELTIPNRGRGR